VRAPNQRALSGTPASSTCSRVSIVLPIGRIAHNYPPQQLAFPNLFLLHLFLFFPHSVRNSALKFLCSYKQRRPLAGQQQPKEAPILRSFLVRRDFSCGRSTHPQFPPPIERAGDEDGRPPCPPSKARNARAVSASSIT